MIWNMLCDPPALLPFFVWANVSVCASVADLYDDHALPATAAQRLLCKAARKRKEVRSQAHYLSAALGQSIYIVLWHTLLLHYTGFNLLVGLCV